MSISKLKWTKIIHIPGKYCGSTGNGREYYRCDSDGPFYGSIAVSNPVTTKTAPLFLDTKTAIKLAGLSKFIVSAVYQTCPPSTITFECSEFEAAVLVAVFTMRCKKECSQRILAAQKTYDFAMLMEGVSLLPSQVTIRLSTEEYQNLLALSRWASSADAAKTKYLQTALKNAEYSFK